MKDWPWPSSFEDYHIKSSVILSFHNGREIELRGGIPFDGFGTTPGAWGIFLDERDDGEPDWESLVTWRINPNEPPPSVRLSNSDIHQAA